MKPCVLCVHVCVCGVYMCERDTTPCGVHMCACTFPFCVHVCACVPLSQCMFIRDTMK